MIFNLIYFLLISLSFSYMWSFSEIFRSPRNLISKIPYIRRPFICPECCSFWVGLAVSFLYNPIVLDHTFLGLPNIICGLTTHLIACFLYKNIKPKENTITFIN